MVLIWDALDECSESRALLLSLLGGLHTLPQSTRIFLTSRLEDDLDRARHSLMAKVQLHHRNLTFNRKDKHDMTCSDISTFMRYHLEHVEQKWPSDIAFEKLNHVVDGLFMIAEFVCMFLNHPEKDSRLESLLDNTSFDESVTPTQKLYLRYRTGLCHIFKDDSVAEVEQAKSVMSAIWGVQRPVSAKILATLVRLDEEKVIRILDRLAPFLDGWNTAVKEHLTPIRFVHKSMSDFLISELANTSDTRIAPATARGYRINPVAASACLALPCLQILCNEVPEALLWMQSHVPVTEALEGGRQKLWLPDKFQALDYACRFWGHHLKEVAEMDNSLDIQMKDLFFTHLLEWLHMMGCLGALDSALSCLHSTVGWKVGLLA